MRILWSYQFNIFLKIWLASLLFRTNININVLIWHADTPCLLLALVLVSLNSALGYLLLIDDGFLIKGLSNLSGATSSVSICCSAPSAQDFNRRDLFVV